mmetsp:Transcript_68550/g.198930  ORF Transcript_68550/g.198930 Transcript_68550/m.198930 type:complete len:267 (-) Transcript_68550:1077-1877(-)
MSAVYALWSTMRTSRSLRMRPRCASSELIASPWLSEECCKTRTQLPIFSRKVTASSRSAWSILVQAARPSCASTFTAFVAVAVSVSCRCAHSRCSTSFSWTKLISCFVTSNLQCKSPRSLSSRAASCSKSLRFRSTSLRQSARFEARPSARSFSICPNLALDMRTNSSKRSLTTLNVDSVIAFTSSTRLLMSASFCKMTDFVSWKRSSVLSASDCTLEAVSAKSSWRTRSSSSAACCIPSLSNFSIRSRSSWLCCLCSSRRSQTVL